MIKRLIFDLDNTLIMWKDEYKDAIKKTIEHFKININYLDVDNVIEKYEEYYDRYDKEFFVSLINSEFNINVNTDFIDYWLNELGNMTTVNEELNEMLEYLSSKYELVVLTNWFRESQINRLKNANMACYFKEVYGADEYSKPNPNAFYKAMGSYKSEEVIMIGDSFKTDIKPAIDLGIKTIMITNEKRKDTVTIKSILELKEML